MKIVLWSSKYLPDIGGLEVMVHELALQLQKQGHSVLVITEKNTITEKVFQGIPVYGFPFTQALRHFDLVIIKQILHRIIQILKFFEPDIVNVHGWYECYAFYQVRVLQEHKYPLCITVHGLLEQKNYTTAACQKLWSMASGVNTVSNAISEELHTAHITHPFLRTIYNGLPSSSSPTLPIPLSPITLVMVGRLTKEKCFEIAFQALPFLLKKYPNIKLCLVGGGIEYEPLQQLIQKLHLEKTIEMTDFIPPHKVEKYLDQATLVLVPSYYESFSLTALSAAMRGRPVIASNVLGLKEVVEHGVSGLLVEPQQPEILAEAIDFLLQRPELLIKMGSAAESRAKLLFTIEITTQNYINMYTHAKTTHQHHHPCV